MSEKCRNSINSDNPLTSRRADGGKNLNKPDWGVPQTQQSGEGEKFLLTT